MLPMANMRRGGAPLCLPSAWLFTSLSCVCVLIGSGHSLADLLQPQYSPGISCHLEIGKKKKDEKNTRPQTGIFRLPQTQQGTKVHQGRRKGSLLSVLRSRGPGAPLDGCQAQKALFLLCFQSLSMAQLASGISFIPSLSSTS